MKREFPGYQVYAVDSSWTMLDYGAENFNMPTENQFCSTVQEFDFRPWVKQVSVWLCWWNLCNLSSQDIRRYLANMMSTLRAPRYDGIRYLESSHAGFLLIAEPTGQEFEHNNHLG